ncbi:MAG TPA: hypothetical protein VGK33_11525 [Chloroflexota bacterium]
MFAEPVILEKRPQLEIVANPRPDVTSEPIELRASARPAGARPPLTMSGVTAGLQLLLAARRAARFSALGE